MKTQILRIFILLFFGAAYGAYTITVQAQTARERADVLRSQLEEVQTKELDLQNRLQLVEEQLKPENIEKSLAGIGSTKPEELRDRRRKQLEIQQQSIQKQLSLLAESKSRLESGVAQAEADAYHDSARVAGEQQVTSAPPKQTRPSGKVPPRRVYKRAYR